MDFSTSKMAPQTSLFQVFLRLRPPMQQNQQPSEPWLIVEPPVPTEEGLEEPTKPVSTHITLQPPNDSRKRAIERFGFTKVFPENASQLDLFEETGAVENIRSVLTKGRDGLIATLGVTGSGKSHTILGSKSQRGLTQMSLDVLFRSIGDSIRRPTQAGFPVDTQLLQSLQASDPSEAQIIAAASFFECVYGDGDRARHSRAQTPMTGVGSRAQTPMMDAFGTHHPRKPPMPRPSTFAQAPDMSAHNIDVDQGSDYAVLVSMYEVYNDRIFDLLSNSSSNMQQTLSVRAAALQKNLTRRPLLFKNTETSPDRKVVAGLKKIVCCSYDEAMMVLETGLTERRVAGTGSNSVSSRSHGFFCIEVKRKARGNHYAGYFSEPWTGGTLSIVDLAGSERARNAKTTGSTLAEAGKINESLMYLGQCLQVQSDCQQDGTKPIVPFRQCKLTELLFSNSFPSAGHAPTYRSPQKAVMIVTADAKGDFNATSQILRYSALAREVTVPRIPSVTTAMGPTKAISSGRNTPGEMPNSYFSAQELEQAHYEISRLAEECNALAVRVAEEEIQRTEAELKLQAAEERILVAEQEIREECWQEMEQMIEDQKERWRAAWEAERLNGQDFIDGKIEILEKTSSFRIYEDDTTTTDRMEELERENELLRSKMATLSQEMQTKSPTKKPRAPKTPARSSNKLVLEQSTNASLIVDPFVASPKQADTQNQSAGYPMLKPISSVAINFGDDENEPSLAEFNTSMSTLSSVSLAVEDVSPRKLSLRNSTLRTSVMGSTSASPVKLSMIAEPLTPGTGKKKTRKLTARKWDLGDSDDL